MNKLDKNELAKIGLHYGSYTRKYNPKMKEYVYSKKVYKNIVKSTTDTGKIIYKNSYSKHILNLDKILASCIEVKEYLRNLLKGKKKILFIYTKNKDKNGDVVKEFAIKCNMPYINYKWKGGFLTNFNVMRLKIKELNDLKMFMEKESFRKLTKKQQASTEKRFKKLNRIYEGVSSLWYKPDVLFIIGSQSCKGAIKEANKLEIPVISVCNSNSNPKIVDFPIIGNDESVESVSFFAKLISDYIIELTNSH